MRTIVTIVTRYVRIGRFLGAMSFYDPKHSERVVNRKKRRGKKQFVIWSHKHPFWRQDRYRELKRGTNSNNQEDAGMQSAARV